MAATDVTRGSVRSDGNGSPVNLPDGGGTVAEREYEEYILAERDSGGEEPDVLLDVPVVKVDEITFEVEELRARILLQAEVLDLLKLNVGADVFIGHVGLEIKGVEAQALLKVRLDNVARILDRVLTTIDRNLSCSKASSKAPARLSPRSARAPAPPWRTSEKAPDRR